MANSKTKEKWEYLKGEETVYTSSLDLLGEREHHAWGACVPKMAELFGGWGWETRLNELSKDKVRQLVLTITLEFEKHMKLEQLPEGDAPLFFDVKVKIPVPSQEKGKAGGLIPPGMEAPRKPRTGPVTNADFPWESESDNDTPF